MVVANYKNSASLGLVIGNGSLFRDNSTALSESDCKRHWEMALANKQTQQLSFMSKFGRRTKFIMSLYTVALPS